jgi:CTP synthase (UTP-ammonia lyase)
MRIRVALIGDYNAEVVAHRAIPLALNHAGSLEFDWKHTARIGSLDGYHGVWCVPASPYASEAGAIGAIRWARENSVPFLGTCGGFQHAVLEFARNVLGLREATHAETTEGGDCVVIERLSCPLVEVERLVFAVPGTRLAEIYGSSEIKAGYHCNFGLNPRFERALEQAGMRVAGRDAEGIRFS